MTPRPETATPVKSLFPSVPPCPGRAGAPGSAASRPHLGGAPGSAASRPDLARAPHPTASRPHLGGAPRSALRPARPGLRRGLLAFGFALPALFLFACTADYRDLDKDEAVGLVRETYEAMAEGEWDKAEKLMTPENMEIESMKKAFELMGNLGENLGVEEAKPTSDIGKIPFDKYRFVKNDSLAKLYPDSAFAAAAESLSFRPSTTKSFYFRKTGEEWKLYGMSELAGI